MGVRLRGRPDGRGRDRPRRPPREAPAVPRGVLPREARAHAVARGRSERVLRKPEQSAQKLMTILLTPA